MRTSKLAAITLSVAGLLALAAPHAARAESIDLDAVTLGAMTESADWVGVLSEPRVVPESRTRNAVIYEFGGARTIRGAEPSAALRVVVPSAGELTATRAPVFACLRRSADGSFEPLSTPHGWFGASDPGMAPIAEYARAYASCLDPSGSVAKPDALAALLVGAVASPHSGVPLSAGRDLVRHEELHARLSAEQRDSVVRALGAPRRADRDLEAIVLAVGAVGGSGADEALADRLLDPASRHLRLALGEAFRRRASPELVRLLVRRLDAAAGTSPSPDADSRARAVRRADLANALGRISIPECEAPLLALLADAVPLVRVEACRAAGCLAREIRAPKPGSGGIADADAPRPKLTSAVAPLLAAIDRAAGEAGEDGRTAALRALADIDDQSAWDALRRISREHPEARVRALALQQLK